MASPAPALLKLLSQVNARWPNRSRASDGIMGDAKHQVRVSDHNLGNAIDFTRSDDGPDLLSLAEAALKDDRVDHVILDSRIRSRARIQPGVWRPYNGANKHDKHVHISIEAAKRDDTRDWVLPAGTGVPSNDGGEGSPPFLPPDPQPSGGWARAVGAAMMLAGVVWIFTRR